jgi:hypothetical protein
MCCTPRADFTRLRLLLLLVSALATAAVGCETEAPVEPDANTGPPIEVQLPPVPQIDLERPVSYPDGSISVWGLMSQRDQLLRESVHVTGYLEEIYICENRPLQDVVDHAIRYAEELPEGSGLAAEDRCNFPHLFLVDRLGSDQRLLVTGYEAVMEPLFTVGERYDVRGRYLEETRGFNRAGDGLIHATEIHGGRLDEPLEGEPGAAGTTP